MASKIPACFFIDADTRTYAPDETRLYVCFYEARVQELSHIHLKHDAPPIRALFHAQLPLPLVPLEDPVELYAEDVHKVRSAPTAPHYVGRSCLFVSIGCAHSEHRAAHRGSQSTEAHTSMPSSHCPSCAGRPSMLCTQSEHRDIKSAEH